MTPVTPSSTRSRRAVLAAGVVGVAPRLLRAAALSPFVWESALHSHDAHLMDWPGEHPPQMLCAFRRVLTQVPALATPGCAVLAGGAGAAFGRSAGILLAGLASAAGATLAFLVARRFGRKPLRRRRGPLLEAIDAGVVSRARGGLPARALEASVTLSTALPGARRQRAEHAA